MENNIKKILDDLYRIDPSLREYEGLEQLVREMVSARPDAAFDESFARKLRAELLKEMGKQKRTPSPYVVFFRYRSVLVALAIVVLAGVPMLLQYGRSGDGTLALAPKFTESEPNAFGAFSASGGVRSMEAGMAQGGDQLGVAEDTSAPEMMSVDEDMATRDAKEDAAMSIAPYDPTIFTFEYAGEEFDMENSTGNVLKRVTGMTASQGLLSAIQNATIGGVNMSSFKNLTVQHLQLTEDGSNGYSISVDFLNGSVYIHSNRGYAVEPGMDRPLTEGEKMSDAEALRIAGDFLRSRNIDLSAYGTPFVRNHGEYRTMAADELTYIPSTLMVVYPLVLDDTPVYDEGGMQHGIGVHIDVRGKNVQSVGEIASQTYTRSSYALETDMNKLLSFMNDRSRLWMPEGTEVKEEVVTLGTPERVYMRHWKYDEKTRTSGEFLVPALVFPVMNRSQDSKYYSDHVVIPLLPDMLEIPDHHDKPDHHILPVPEPLQHEGGDGAGVSGSAGTETMPEIMIEQ